MSYIVYSDSHDIYIEKEVSAIQLPTMHHHRSFELYYLVKGNREYFIEDRFFSVGEGDLVLIPQKVFHRTAGKGGLRFLIHFTDTFLEKFFTPATLTPLLEGVPFVFRANEKDRYHILTNLENMLSEYNKPTRNEMLLAGCLYQILFTSACAPNNYVPQSYANENITQIIQYINENYNHISDIEQIAEHFFISKFYLCRLFSRNLGISLVAYLNTIKIREACHMLITSNANMTEVSMECGFNSPSYFCKVFKAEKGMSPTEYRKKYK